MKEYTSQLYYLYSLKLSNENWFLYVTKEQDIKDVYISSKIRYEYISNNSPILSYECIKLVDVLEIDFFVKKYMRLYGINKVRGGSYSNEILSIEEQNILSKEINQKFNNYDKPIDITIPEYNNLSDWTIEEIQDRKKEVLEQKKKYDFDQEKYNNLMENLYNTEISINRNILSDIEWFNHIIEILINEYNNNNNNNINFKSIFFLYF